MNIINSVITMSSNKCHLQFYSVFILLISFISIARTQFTVPDVEVVALAPQGIRVSIPDIPGIKQFAFHGKIAKKLRIDGEGAFNPTKKKWIFQDNAVQLSPDDRINYWVFVQYEDYGYRKDKQLFVVRRLIPVAEIETNVQTGNTARPGPTRVPQCAPSITIRDGRPACQGRVIFEDKFNTLDKTKWMVEQKLADDQHENPFVSYQTTAVSIDQNRIKITPRLQSSVAGFKDKIKTGTLDLRKGCTSNSDEFCYIKAEGANFLPPIISSRLSTKNTFSFKYGRIDIRAQLPQGDWIYPELYLMPTQGSYGATGYDSGVIRIAFARGNLELQSETENFNNNALTGGIILDLVCRASGIVKNSLETEPWGGAFHVYSLIWEPDKLTFLVDDQPYGTVTPPDGGFATFLNSPDCSENPGSSRWSTGSPLAPFDKEFHIVIGVGVGGISDFPDDVGNKPWSNMSPKAKSEFWKQLNNWFSTWEANKSLLVDSIKVTAL